MATVRIYKVAELLGTTSQEVTALLKRDHGIEVKSASSTIEEVVGRQFVERLARQRNISLPGGDMFAETPVVKGKKGPAPAKKAAGAGQAGRAGAAAAAPRQGRQPAAARVAVEPSPTSVAEPEPATVRKLSRRLRPTFIRRSVSDDQTVKLPCRRPKCGRALPRFTPRLHPPRALPRRSEKRRKSARPGRAVPPTLRLRIEEQRPTTPTRRRCRRLPLRGPSGAAQEPIALPCPCRCGPARREPVNLAKTGVGPPGG